MKRGESPIRVTQDLQTYKLPMHWDDDRGAWMDRNGKQVNLPITPKPFIRGVIEPDKLG